MIFITGDTHGDFLRFNTKNFKEQKNLTREDYVIICGDFGGIWDDSKEEKYWLKWLSEKSFTILFVDGNHENYDLLSNYPIQKWNGGNVHFIRDNIIHLMRGQVFNINGFTFFSFGGGYSIDKNDRIPNLSWWDKELPSCAEKNEGLNNLLKYNNKVDYILTHSAPIIYQKKLEKLNIIRLFGNFNELDKYLQQIYSIVRFKKWFLGHYHIEDEYNNMKILYKNIIKL